MTEAWKTWEGQTVDGFPLRQYLGGSDHSAVYLTQLNDGQNAAIKFIPAGADSEAQMTRWRFAGELKHPNLMQLVRIGRCQFSSDEFLYVVMEYAEEDLSQILPQRALEPAETRQILESVLDALTYLRDQGLAHTRIRPSNILASGDQLKISSDTLREIGSAPLTKSESTIYTAPESAATPISSAADVWSLGVTVVETLTQRTPVIRSQTRAELPVPETIPPPFLEIARRCIQQDSARRATLKEISALLNPTAPQQKSLAPGAVPVAETVAIPLDLSKPAKKSLASQHISMIPHTLQPAASPDWVAPKRRSRVALPLLAVILVIGAILAAPRVLNRFSQLQPQAAAVQPTIVPADSVLGPPKEGASPAPKPSADTKNLPADTASAPSGLKRAPADATPPPKRVANSPNESATERAPKSPKTPAAKPPRGAVLYQVVPDATRARETIQGTVRVNVKVRVDANGNVAGANLDNGANKFFGDQALEVVRRWQFRPPQVDGHDQPSEWLLRFEFSSAATKVFPTQTNP
jgi:TonB family protein